MLDDAYVDQLLWMILFITVICAFLVVGSIVHDLFTRREYIKFLKLERARARWSQLVNHK